MRRYLIVDDNLELAENLAEILRDRGDEAEVAGDGPAALALVRPGRFDAVLTDMRMPRMGGAELVHELRRLDPGLAAVVVTAYARDDALAAASREGLLAILPKPPPLAQLLALLQAARRDALVAIVEDDAGLADNLCEALRGRGFAAVTAASVLETDRLAHIAPFAALIDLRVPGGPDGEAMLRLAARHPGLPMIVVSAHPEASPLPARAAFHKPFATADLLEAVERLHAARPGAAEVS
jgi:CheY-like chemotaxis protein